MLGNGFDLAHYLPTSYGHFMSAMKAIEEYKEEVPMKFDDLFIEYLTEDNRKDKDNPFLKTIELYKTDELKISNDIVDDLRKKLKNNGWYQHFKHHLTDI